MPRIAFFDSYYQDFYGAQRSLFTLVSNISSFIEPHVVTTGKGALAVAYEKAGIPVHILRLHPVANQFGGKMFKYGLLNKVRAGSELIRFNLRFSDWIKAKNIDLVYANDLRSLMFVGLGAKLAGRPVVWYVRGELADSPAARIGVALADCIILIAEGLKEKIPETLFRRFRGMCTVLNTGFNIPGSPGDAYDRATMRAQYGLPRDAVVLGLVGSIVHNKGHDLAIEALKILKETTQYRSIHLCFIGGSVDGHEDVRGELDKRISALGLESNVHWLGHQGDVRPFYAMMDVVVLPSRSEGLPRVLIEGLSAGLPVVATDVGGVSDIVTGNHLGRMVQPNDPVSLARAIAEVLDDPRRNDAEIVKQRIEYVNEKFSLDAYVSGFESIVTELMARRKSSV